MEKKQKLWTALLIGAAAVVFLVGCFFLIRALRPAPEPANCLTHKDGDDNGYCDKCNACVLTEIDFYAINDLHGKLADSASQPGVDELTTYLATAGTNTVLLSAGDMWQGSSESNLTGGALTTEWMNAAGFDAMALGNHEFDWGPEAVEANAPLAEFPFLAINAYSRETHERLPYCSASVMLERGGVKIGIIGAIGDVYSSISSERSSDIYFLTGQQLTALVKEEATKLRKAGAGFIVYLIHDGYGHSTEGTYNVPSSSLSDYYDASLSKSYVDLVFEGHTHQRYILKDRCGVYHLQGGAENSGISHAELSFNTVTGSFRLTTAEVISNSEYALSEPSPLWNELVDRYADSIALGKTALGLNPVTRDSDYLKALVARLYYELGVKTWGEEYPIVLGGGFLSVRSPYHLDAGIVEYSHLQMLFPFDNQLVLCEISGSDLKTQFLESKNSNYFCYTGSYGDFVRENLDPNARYYIVVDSYSSQYKPNRCTEITRFTPGIYARDLLANYFSGQPLGTPTDSEYTGPSYTLSTIPELLALGAALDPGESSENGYYVSGTIESVENDTYGNVWIRDANGNRLYVYGINDSGTNTRYGQMKDRPKVGDSIVLYGVLQHYVSAGGQELIEMYRALLIHE